MAKLTELLIRNFKEPGRLADGEGLSFELTKSGIRRWIYRYRFESRQQMFVVGRYPSLSLKEARKAHREAKELVSKGIKPSDIRKQEKQKNILSGRKTRESENTLETISYEWLDKKKPRWTKGHYDDVVRSLIKDVFPYLGHTHIESIQPIDIVTILHNVEKRGASGSAKKLLQRVGAICRYAVQTGRLTYNPAGDMKGVLENTSKRHMPAVFGQELGDLLQDITTHSRTHITTKLALKFTALTACRPGEVRLSKWKDIDLTSKEWHIPAERMKMRRSHVVPLSTQAIAILERAAILFGKRGYAFPSAWDQEKPMSDGAMSKALRGMGYRGKATPHGFRSSFSSTAYEKSGFPGEVIEKCLAHEERNKVKGAYNRAEYLEQRHQIMQWWGDELQKLETQQL